MIFDGHSDIFSDVYNRSLLGETDVIKSRHIDKLRKGGVDGTCIVVWNDPDDHRTDLATQFKARLAAAREEIKISTCTRLCLTADDLEKAYADGIFGYLFGIEGMSGAGEDVDMIDELYDMGVRHIGLSWNEQNDMATGVAGDPSRGLTEVGKRAVKRAQDKHILMDVSHLNEKSFWDLASCATAPFVATHSDAKALCGAARNLTDEQLLAIRDAGGFVGLNAYRGFVCNDPEKSSADLLIEHAKYIADKIGTEHLALGFDFFQYLHEEEGAEITYIKDLEDCTKVASFMEKLSAAGFTEHDIRLISSENWMRVLRKI